MAALGSERIANAAVSICGLNEAFDCASSILAFWLQAECHGYYDAAAWEQSERIAAGRGCSCKVYGVDTTHNERISRVRWGDADRLLFIEQVIEAQADIGLVEDAVVPHGVVQEQIDEIEGIDGDLII
jgi:hypothetical protein